MNNRKRIALFGAIAGIALAGNAFGQGTFGGNPNDDVCGCDAGDADSGDMFNDNLGLPIVAVDADITVDTEWTNDNIYCLRAAGQGGQVFVRDGATLTIQAGTQIRSSGGMLAIARGATINAMGTEASPIIFTSSCDDGTWREAALEWGNLTILGNGVIGAARRAGNPVGPATDGDPNNPGDSVEDPVDGTAQADMEGLVAPSPRGGLDEGANLIRYGGGDDDDSSGTLNYVSIRYGGKVLGLGNELNGLSLGGIGRGTDISHIEIMNNVDDGIEIWGGTVNINYFSIWNIGDDSFDIDQGWRGQAQFGLIVQGYSLNASQGSGVGDNCFEHDGAEDANAQPVTTGSIYNVTVIGQPIDGDGATAWRDNARMQYRNCIFMDIGEHVVREDGDDGDGQSGYGFDGTHSFADIWTTTFNTPEVGLKYNGVAPFDPATLYQAQSAGNAARGGGPGDGQGWLAEITDTVFYSNNWSRANEDLVLTINVNDAGSTATTATAELAGDILSLTDDAGVDVDWDLTSAAFDTIGEVKAAVNALGNGWNAVNNPAFDSVDSSEVNEFGAVNVLGQLVDGDAAPLEWPNGTFTTAYTNSDARGVTVGGDDDPADFNVVADMMPIQSITRAATVSKGGKDMQQVISLDPRAANDAVHSAGSAPNAARGGDGFFRAANFRGGFPANHNWLCGWSAADEFGFIVANPCPNDVDGSGMVGLGDLLAVLSGWGSSDPLDPTDIDCSGVVGLGDLLSVLSNWGNTCP